MQLHSVTHLYFSPTGTTRKISESIENGIGSRYTNSIDITKIDSRTNNKLKINSDIVVIGFPVYEEHIPYIVKEYLELISIEAKAAIIFCLYGNVAYGKSLKEACAILTKKNIKILSLGAFIGEHSFASKDVFLGVGRPNSDDIALAHNLGVVSKERYENSIFLTYNEIPENCLIIEKIIPKNGAKLISKAPTVNSTNCTKCNACIIDCPMGAISSDYSIQKKKCIRCYACVRTCKFNAREIRYKSRIVKIFLNYMNKEKKESIII